MTLGLGVSKRQQKRLLVAFVLFVFLGSFFYYTNQARGATYTWDGEGATNNWSDCDNWTSNTCPGSADTAAFDGTNTSDSIVDTGFSGTVAAVDINSGYTGTITQELSTLTITTGSYNQADGTWDQGTTTLNINDSHFIMSGGTFNTSSSTTNTIEQNFTVTGGTFNASSSKVFNFVDNTNFEDTTFTYPGEFPATVDVTKTRQGSDFTLASGSIVNRWEATVQQTYYFTEQVFTIQSGAEAHFGTSSVRVGSLTISGTSTASSTLDIDHNFTLNSGAYFYFGNTSMNIGGDYTDNGGTFDESGITFVFDDTNSSSPTIFTYSGVFPGTVDIAKDQINGNFTITSGATIDKWDSAISMSYTDSLTLTIQNGAAAHFSNTSINVESLVISGTTTASSTLNIGSDFTLNSTGYFAYDGASISISDDYTDNGGTFDETGILFVFDDESNNHVTLFTYPGVFPGTVDIVKNNFGGGFTLASGATITLGDNISISGSGGDLTVNGNLQTAGYTVSVVDQFTISTGATLTIQGGETIPTPTLSEDSTVEYNGASTYSSLIAGYDYENLSFTGGGTYNIANDINVEDDFTSTNDSTLNQTSGTFTLDGTDQTVTGTSTLNAFTKTVASAATLTFGANQTQMISGTLTLQGASGQDLTLVSNSPGTQYKIDMQSARTLEYLNVTDINNTNTDTAYCETGCTNGGNNTNFEFTADPDNGYIYWDNGGGDGLWSTCANWKFNTCPDANFVAAFDSRSTADANLDTSFAGSVNGLVINSGYTGTITSYRSLLASSTGFSQADGTFVAPTSTLTVSSFTHTGGTFTHNSGEVWIAGGDSTLTTSASTNFYDLMIEQTGSYDGNLLSHWTLDENEAGATVTDGNSNYTGTASKNTNVLNSSTGERGDAFTFDGTDDYVSFGDVAELDTASAFSISLWFNRNLDNNDATNHNVENILIAQSSSADNDNIEIGSNGSSIQVYLDTISYDPSTSPETYDIGLTDDTWYHLVLTYDSGDSTEMHLYVDGTLEGSSALWGSTLDSSAASPLSIGIARAGSDNWGDYNGQIDEVRVYTRALSAAEVTDLYQKSLYLDATAKTVTLDANTLDVANKLRILSTTTLDVSTANCSSSPCNIEVAGDWTNDGTFTARTGKVTFDGTSQNITGTTTFYDFTKSVASADTLTFGANETFTIDGTMTINGASGNLLTVTSSDGSTDWNISGGTYTVNASYLNLNYSNSTNNLYCYPDCTDGGTNTNWLFEERPLPRQQYRLQGGTRWQGGIRFGL